MSSHDKPLVWLQSEVKTPPFSMTARLEAGYLLRRLQRGESIGLPHSRPMPAVGRRCHELRIQDMGSTWRLFYRIEPDAVVVLHVFQKKSAKTPLDVIRLCQTRLREYEDA